MRVFTCNNIVNDEVALTLPIPLVAHVSYIGTKIEVRYDDLSRVAYADTDNTVGTPTMGDFHTLQHTCKQIAK